MIVFLFTLLLGPGLKLNPVYAQYLAGNNLKGIIFDNLAKAYGEF